MSAASPSSQHHQLLAPIANHSTVSSSPSSLNKPTKLALVHIPNSPGAHKLQSSASLLSPFDKIKLETDRKTAHGHPLILPSEYGRFGPIFDVFALYHNAVKRQTIVAYNILEAFHRFKYEVTQAETELFFDWFQMFEDAVVTILNVEEEQVFPFLEQHGVILPDALNSDERQEAKSQISESLSRITTSLETIRLLAAGESINRISSMVRAFLKVIIDYLEVQRTALPNAIIAADIPVDNETPLHKTFIDAVFAKNSAAICLPFLSHWLSRRQLRAWKKANLSLLRALRYDQWKKRFSSTYQEIPITILTRLTSATPSGTRGKSRKSTAANTSYYGGRKNRYKFR